MSLVLAAAPRPAYSINPVVARHALAPSGIYGFASSTSAVIHIAGSAAVTFAPAAFSASRISSKVVEVRTPMFGIVHAQIAP